MPVCLYLCLSICLFVCLYTDLYTIDIAIIVAADSSAQICPFLAVRPQFDSDHHQNRQLSSHSYSHESVILFVFYGLIFVKLRRLFSLNACGYATAAVENNTAGSVHCITIGDSRLCSVASATGLRDAESIIFNRGRSVASWTFRGRVFHPAQRSVERAPA